VEQSVCGIRFNQSGNSFHAHADVPALVDDDFLEVLSADVVPQRQFPIRPRLLMPITGNLFSFELLLIHDYISSFTPLSAGMIFVLVK